MNNGQYIRTRTDRELAVWITEHISNCDECPVTDCSGDVRCSELTYRWLREERKE